MTPTTDSSQEPAMSGQYASLRIKGMGNFSRRIDISCLASVEPRRRLACGKVSECQDGARDTMVFIAGAGITHQYGNAGGSNAELDGVDS
jgi:hypothetical protein